MFMLDCCRRPSLGVDWVFFGGQRKNKLIPFLTKRNILPFPSIFLKFIDRARIFCRWEKYFQVKFSPHHQWELSPKCHQWKFSPICGVCCASYSMDNFFLFVDLCGTPMKNHPSKCWILITRWGMKVLLSTSLSTYRRHPSFDIAELILNNNWCRLSVFSTTLPCP